jgi:hypothetical protein
MLGVTDGSDAAVGQVGEYRTVIAANAGITSNSILALVTLPLTAGDWDIWGNVNWTPTAGLNYAVGGISNASGTIPGQGSPGQSSIAFTSTILASNTSLPVTMTRILSAAAFTAYLNVVCTFASGTCQVAGSLSARRRR